MKTVYALFWADGMGIKRWFATQSVSKILVVLGFIGVFCGLGIGIFQFSGFFFRDLASYHVYGFITAEYLIHAAIVMIFFLAMGSSIASTSTFLLTPHRTIDYLVSLPIKPQYITIWLFLKSLLLNSTLLLFLLTPIVFSFSLAFWNTLTFFFIARFLFVLIVMVGITHSLGSVVAYYLASFLKGKGFIGMLLGIGLFFLSFIGVLRLILPASLETISQASGTEFFAEYNRLPLSNPLLPTNWLAKTVVQGVGYWTLFAGVVGAFCVIFAYMVQTKRFLLLFQQLKVQPYISRISARELFAYSGSSTSPLSALIYKDFLSIIRYPSETGYGLFLFLLTVSFFLFFTRIDFVKTPETGTRQIELIVFSLISLLFYVSCFLLRLVFPLMAREGRAAWYSFTLPISRATFLWSKVLLGFVLVFPYVIFSLLLWPLLPFSKNIYVLTGISVSSIVILALAHGLLGCVFPNFKEGGEAEKVSTSTMGIVALLASILIVVVMGVSIFSFLHGVFIFERMLLFILLFTFYFLSLLFFLAFLSLKRYEF